MIGVIVEKTVKNIMCYSERLNNVLQSFICILLSLLAGADEKMINLIKC